MIKKIIRILAFPVESIGALIFLGVLRYLPLLVVQRIGRIVGRFIGYIHPANTIIHRNLALSKTTVRNPRQFASEVWENFAMLVAEYTHTHAYKNYIRTHLTVEGKEHLDAFVNSDKSGILVSAHIGNWAIGTAYIYAHTRRRLAMIHRPPNNAFVNHLVHFIHAPFSDTIVEKKSYAGQQLLRLLKQNSDVVMLIDQKNNTGVSLPFLGKEARTTTGPALLTLRDNRPILPFVCTRNPDGTFTLRFEPVLWPDQFKKTKHPVLALTAKLNETCDTWIHTVGSQWFWLHKRYPRDTYND